MALSDEMNQGEIDWTAIARKLGTLRENGESGGSTTAREAVAMIMRSTRMKKILMRGSTQLNFSVS